jgi:hypothetical protein
VNGNNRNLAVDRAAASATESAQVESRPGGNVWPWVNWGLALSTVPAAAIVMLFALGAVMSTDACSDRQCPDLGRGGIDFGVAFYGAPAVALAVIVISFFTAKRRGGIAIPLWMGAIGRRRRRHGGHGRPVTRAVASGVVRIRRYPARYPAAALAVARE